MNSDVLNFNMLCNCAEKHNLIKYDNEALLYYTEALKMSLFNKNIDKLQSIFIMEKIALIYINIKMYVESAKFYLLIIDNVNCNVAYYKIIYNKLFELYAKYFDNEQKRDLLHALGDIYYSKNNINKAKDFYVKSYNKNNNIINITKNNNQNILLLKTLYKIYCDEQNFDEAVKYKILLFNFDYYSSKCNMKCYDNINIFHKN
jgi:hypothetical protein